ncbi:phosphatidylinositol 3,4,5-trisphosphate 3-phosphatase and protein-tyrosine-phosphatase PTEN2A [Amaranthus tricolor]|uniref:phosphatidylinositol 3,4,5-trisphosphate 3-phosphatase and protein-tyrosine-phosphatase PTEN2A n=1 Tax=Amaranthus tricolor TaxID=29722 RepID=UPI002582E07A|nr:phosphatidylinositol 3,4,5-trisphosphate 3-phosphatase and protein-tyrosine-phosphatase PTEN2A [Amaranthus tricolor]XP_057546195.1 phosphatidylinositol 3,4,5-trisphosphate 3-phosphatase and protein-tyrosine-phosphatase PTEN2A [Amaranthus tricolor]
MEAGPVDSSVAPETPPVKSLDTHPTTTTDAVNAATDGSPKQSMLGISSWARSLKIPTPSAGGQAELPTENSPKSAFARFTSGIASRLSPREPTPEQGAEAGSSQSNFFGTITRGLVDTSKSAARAVSVKARHVVSQNKRRYQENGYDLDMTYITENIIAMGFPAGDMSSGFFGYVEGLYRNHMEDVISFLESHHKDKYKVYNLCSERLYDASLFEGKVASCPFDDHNCPPIRLILSFCQSAYSWLKEDIENVVVVHCKAGMARTGLMISSLLLYLKFFPTAEESIDYYNQKRCFDGKALVLPSQIRYVKYFERTLTYFNGEIQPGRRCMLRGFRLHRCPYWIRPHITVSDHNSVLFSTKKHPRTKDLTTEDFWFTAPKKGIMVFALPGEPGLTELSGDFKVHFHDRQGDFYFWLNTTMVENRKILNTGDMDGFDKRKLPSPGFQVEIVLVDYDGTPPSPTTPHPENVAQKPGEKPGNEPSSGPEAGKDSQSHAQSEQQDKDDVFSDDESEGSGLSRGRKAQAASSVEAAKSTTPPSETNTISNQKVDGLAREVEKVSLGKGDSTEGHSLKDYKTEGAATALPALNTEGVSEFKAMAADASVFTFGDEDYESD